MFNTPMSLLSLTEDVTRTFVPSEQLRVNIERDRGLEEGTAAQITQTDLAEAIGASLLQSIVYTL
ncbi:unnamed protein product [Brassica rapa subsp. trilocularis]|uniref:Uncharacterized protein n=1 Tax=Brassica campestris TaxID=3711 RepID=M4EL73_BRACM